MENNMSKQVSSKQVNWHFSEEKFNFFNHQFDIKKAKQILAKKDRLSLACDLKQSMDQLSEPDQPNFKILGIYIDWTKTDLDMSIPLIAGFIPLPKKRGQPKQLFPLIIDGWHRIGQAKRLGITSLQTFYLTEKETKSIMGGI